MPLNADEEDEESIQNMVSNLPLLFANGYPSTLDKITEKQLEKFIPFMVQCSLGNLQYQTCFEHNEPEWWPEDLEFIHPFAKPKCFAGDWYAKMKELVIICYMFHKSVYLLRFCNELSSYEPECLRFINNYNSTTSLYDRVHNKILVTFRNENMLYDQQSPCGRKTLLTKSQMQGNTQMVETEPFDIYLCDNCDAELYSLEAYKEHEKTCMLEDDVIICDDDEDDDEVEFVGTQIDQRPMADFLLNFNLQSTSAPHTSKLRTTINSESIAGSPEKLKRLPRKSRGTIALTRCNSIPLSSPCGVLLMKRAKTIMTEDYQMERLDRLERFCFAPALKAGSNRPKWFGKNKNVTSCTVTYKKPHDHIKQPYHTFKFPRRQFRNTSKMRNLAFIQTLQLAQCKPLSVNLQRLTKQDIEVHMAKLNHYKSKLNTFKKKAVRTHIVEFIDLCSSGSENENEVEDEVPETTEHISLCSDEDENSESQNVRTENKDVAETASSNLANPSSIQSQLQLQPLRTSYLFSNNIESTTPTTPAPAANESIDNFSAINEWLNNNANNRRSTAIDKVLGNSLCRNLAHEMANFTT